MTQPEQYDAIVIGAGQSGGPLSTALAIAGWKTAIIEREHVGGTCINEGCTPTKTMVANARVAYLARRSAEYGVHAGPVTVNMKEVRQRKRAMVESFRQSSQRRIEEVKGVDLIMGEATFTAPKTLKVSMSSGDARNLAAARIFINTGARPSKPPLEGLDNVPFLNSTSIMELEVVPQHLLVLGGGYVGLEFAQMFRRFGSKITVVQRGNQLLQAEDSDVAEEVTKIMREDGIEVLLLAQAVRVQQHENHIRLTLKTPNGERALIGSHLLVATGRTPNTDGLNLAAAGVETDARGYIPVNAHLETNVPGIYALGDVNGGPAFTHISYDDFRILKENLLEGGDRTTTGRLIPYTIFIDPQLGRVGLTEREARQQGKDIKVATMPMSYIARPVEVGEDRGFLKAVVEGETKQILGCAALGMEGGEIMAMLEIAMLGHLPYTVLRDAIFAHPTLAEGLNNLFSRLE